MVYTLLRVRLYHLFVEVCWHFAILLYRYISRVISINEGYIFDDWVPTCLRLDALAWA
jgi:hypothetical protein